MSYLNEFLTGRGIHKAVRAAEKRLHGVEFDAIAVRGNSGLLIGSPLAVRLGKNLLIVRKKKEKSHSSYPVEGMMKFINQRVLILDDFSETGNTVKQICNKINSHCQTPEIIGVYFYNSSTDNNSAEPEIFEVTKKVTLDMYRPRRADKRENSTYNILG